MGSYYHLDNRRCPYCHGKLPKVIFAEYLEDYGCDGEWMGNNYTCEHCGRTFDIKMRFVFERIK